MLEGGMIPARCSKTVRCVIEMEKVYLLGNGIRVGYWMEDDEGCLTLIGMKYQWGIGR